jgi:hypothetical protein
MSRRADARPSQATSADSAHESVEEFIFNDSVVPHFVPYLRIGRNFIVFGEFLEIGQIDFAKNSHGCSASRGLSMQSKETGGRGLVFEILEVKDQL